MSSALPSDGRARFERDGFLVLEGAVEPSVVATLATEADRAVAWQEERMRRGERVDSINRLGQHYFIPRLCLERPALRRYALGALMAEICRALLGDEAYLFNELFVCKEPRSTIPFGWHQDTGYVHAFGFRDFPPNITAWTALGPMRRDNGALWVKSFSSGATREIVAHAPDAHGNQVAQFPAGEERLLEVGAGSVIVMAGNLPHKSEPNQSDERRRAYLCQFGPTPILAGGRPVQLAERLLDAGRHVTP